MRGRRKMRAYAKYAAENFPALFTIARCANQALFAAIAADERGTAGVVDERGIVE